MWLEGPSGFGYADGDDNTLLDDMMGMYWSVYIRTGFEVPDVNQFPVLQFGAQWDETCNPWASATAAAVRNPEYPPHRVASI